MKWKFLLTAASAVLLAGSGGAFAQGMQGGAGAAQQQQQMNQQMQNIQQQQDMRRHHTDEQSKDQDQAQPQTGPQGSQEHQTMGGGMQKGESAHGTAVARTLTTEQKTRIRTTVIERPDAPRIANVNFTIRVGVPIPRTVRVVPVPEEIVAIYPEWTGFLYFVTDEEIVVIDPASYEIVGTLEA